MSTHRPSGRAGSAFKHGLTSRHAVKEMEEDESMLAKELMDGAPPTLAVLEAARDLASTILHLQQVREVKTKAAGMRGRQVRKPRQKKKARADWDDGLSDRLLIRALREVGAERGLFQQTGPNAAEQATQLHPQPDAQEPSEPEQGSEAQAPAAAVRPEETVAMLRWVQARFREVYAGRKLTHRQIVGRRLLKDLLDDAIELQRAEDGASETQEVTLEQTLENLRRLDDYECRALSRRKKAIRRLDYEILEARRRGKAA